MAKINGQVGGMGYVQGGAIEHAVRAGDVAALSAAFHCMVAGPEPGTHDSAVGHTPPRGDAATPAPATAAPDLVALQPMATKGAAEAGQVEIIQWLYDWAVLQKGEEVEAAAAGGGDSSSSSSSDDGGSRVHQVAQQCMDTLLGRQDIGGATALHWAAAGGTEGHVATVRWLLEAGAAVDARDQHGCQPLHWAARGGHPEVMQLLVAYGADSSAVDSSGVTALHLYCGEGHLAIVQALATPDLEANDGNRSESGSSGGSVCLGRLNAKDGRGYTPLDWAAGCGRHEVAAWLKEQHPCQHEHHGR